MQTQWVDEFICQRFIPSKGHCASIIRCDLVIDRLPNFDPSKLLEEIKIVEQQVQKQNQLTDRLSTNRSRSRSRSTTPRDVRASKSWANQKLERLNDQLKQELQRPVNPSINLKVYKISSKNQFFPKTTEPKKPSLKQKKSQYVQMNADFIQFLNQTTKGIIKELVPSDPVAPFFRQIGRSQNKSSQNQQKEFIYAQALQSAIS